MLPERLQLWQPILEAYVLHGGEATNDELYGFILERFPEMTPAELSEKTDKNELRWKHEVRLARWDLQRKGEVKYVGTVVWGITDAGRSRVDRATQRLTLPPLRASSPVLGSSVLSLEEIVETHEQQIRNQIKDRLSQMTDKDFEKLGVELMMALGFEKVSWIGKSGDRGIDGFGMSRPPGAIHKIAYQSKRWAGKVGRPRIQSFRGALNKYDYGIIFTTSDFTSEAVEDAKPESGVKQILLYNGDAIARLMIEKRIRVQSKAIHLYWLADDSRDVGEG